MPATVSGVPPEASSCSRSTGRQRRVTSRRLGEVLTTVALPIAGFVLVIALWQLAITVFHIQEFMLPSPEKVLHTLWTERDQLWFHAKRTTLGFMSGFLLAALIGVPLATLLAFSRVALRLLYPLIIAAQSLPKSALAPLFLVWLGFGLRSEIGIAFLTAIFPVLINTMAGLRALPTQLLYLGKSMGGTRLRIFMKVRLPYALPSIFAGLKVAITLAIIGAVVGEFVGSNEWLGYLIVSTSVNMNTALAFAALVWLAFLSIVSFAAVEVVGRKVCRGREGT
jgi:NitT/TauT family transport system permease protein